MIKIGKDLSKFLIYSCRPTSREELKEIINERISKLGPDCDLNDIDTSLIKDMSYMFYNSSFSGDIANGMCHMLRICGECSLAPISMETSPTGMSAK